MAQQQSIPRIGESIEVSLVNVDVIVTDNGRRVYGLSKDDFEIFEDRKLQRITNFTEYRSERRRADVAPAGAAASEMPAVARQKRTIIIFVDRFTLPQFGSKPLYDGIRSFLREVVRSGDAVSIVSWREQVITRLAFTDDLPAIEDVLQKIAKESGFVSGDEHVQIAAERDFEREIIAFAAEHQVVLENVERPTIGGLAAAMRAKFEMRRKVSAINSLITRISTAEGTKALLLLTHRFSRIAGKEYLNGLNPTLGPVIDPSQRDFDMSNEIETITKTANANNVRIYAFYPEGLGHSAMPHPEIGTAPSPIYDQMVLDNEVHALDEVSQKTGGSLAWGSKAIVDALPEIREELESYYSLAYAARPGANDRTHKIVVKTKNRRYSVRSRSEYVEKSDSTRMRERVIANLFGSATPGTIPIKLSFGHMRSKARGQRSMPVTVSFPSGALVKVPQNNMYAGAFSVYVGGGNTLGYAGEVSRQTRSFQVPINQRENAGKAFTYQFELVTDARTNLVSIAVMDEVGKDYGLARVEIRRDQLSLDHRR